MRLKATKAFISTRHGNVEPGQVLPEVPESLAQQWIDAGMAVKMGEPSYGTKVVQETPGVGDVPLESGEDSDASSSEPAQVSRKRTAKKRAARGESSQ